MTTTTTSVSAILSEKHGIAAQPGAKVECLRQSFEEGTDALLKDSIEFFDEAAFTPKRKGNLWELPRPFERKGTSGNRQADALWRLGLKTKARRLASCCEYGYRVEDRNGHTFWVAFRCGQRFCLRCGPTTFRKIFDNYASLVRLIPDPLPPGWVLACLDFTLKNTGQLPGPPEIRKMNSAIKRVLRGSLKDEGRWGFIYCDDVGYENTNLHAHGIYFGPYLPQGQLSEQWQKETGDSCIVRVRKCKENYSRALGRMLRYLSKPPAGDPEQLARLEAAFHGVRRIHVLGMFYNGGASIKNKTRSPQDEMVCPYCGLYLQRISGYCLISEFQAAGIRGLDEVREEVARVSSLGAHGPP
jgi:hypothetical protein